MAYPDFKGLTRRTASDKLLYDKAYDKIQNMMDINAEMFQWFINFLIKKTSGATHTNKFAGSAVKSKIISNQKLAEESQLMENLKNE